MAPRQTNTRQRLIDAAIEEFARLGYDRATVRDICAAADASVNAVNYHFGDKQQLYIDAVKLAHRRVRSGPGLVEIDTIAERFDGNPKQRLRAFIHGMVAAAMSIEGRTDANHQLLFREIARPTVATEHVVREFIKPHFEQLTRIVEALVPERAEPLRVRLLALSVIGQCLHYKFAAPILPMLLSERERGSLTAPRVAEHICGVIFSAVASGDPLHPSE